MGDSNNVSRDMVHFNYYIWNSIFIRKKKKRHDELAAGQNHHLPDEHMEFMISQLHTLTILE